MQSDANAMADAAVAADFDALFGAGPVASYRCAYDMDWTGEFAGEAVAAITGYDPSDFVEGGGRTWMSIVHPEDRAFLLAVAREAVASGKPFAIEYRIVARGGDVRAVAERGRAVFAADGEFVHFVGEIVARR